MDKMLPLFVCGIAYFFSRDAFVQARGACFVAGDRTRSQAERAPACHFRLNPPDANTRQSVPGPVRRARGC